MKTSALFVLTAGLMAPSIAHAACGDGILDSSEECDDLNNTSGDGCDSSCLIESGWDCADATFELDFSETLTTDMTHSPPSWSISSDLLTVTQSLNAEPAIYASTLPADGVTMTFDLTVNSTSDDDYIGWVIGYEAGEATSTAADWLLFDWKQGDQDWGGYQGYAGLRMYQVQGEITSSYDLWGHTGNVNEVAQATNLGSTGWADNTTYEITVAFDTTHVQVWVDGSLEIDEYGTFDSGNFGFYNFSQESIEYTLVSPVDQSVCGHADTDGDGLSDIIEWELGTDETNADSDGDGIDDYTEVVDSDSPTDTDGDGIIDALDEDDDGDSVDTIDEDVDADGDPTTDDTDGDGIADYLDTDDDGDGLDTDLEDVDADGDPTTDDSDGDGTPDYLDPDDDGDGLDSDLEDPDGDGDITNDDTDGDGTVDYLDPDDDGDGIDSGDEDIDGDGDVTNDDSDGDGVADYLDNDDDGDGIASGDEDTDGDGDPTNDDTDGDGTPDYLDDDSDGDGILDSVDNCVYDANADQSNIDSDEWGDVCDDDADGDGYSSDDCDDTDDTVNPGADEYCDSIDNNCDGEVDESTSLDAVTYYADTDSDGFGDTSSSIDSCTSPSGYVTDDTDCDDTLSSVNTGATEYCNGYDDNCDGTVDEDTAADAGTWFADADGDGFGDSAVTMVSCDEPSGYVADDTECDDTSSLVNPDAAEVCDGIDNDCDGVVDADSVDAQTWYADSDGDSFGDSADSVMACDQPSGYVADELDCDDADLAVNPDADEYCDSIDNNCDGLVDDPSSVDAVTWYMDSDSDGYGDAAYSTTSCDQPTGMVEDASDCDDADIDSNPGASELWYDGVDQDCDGLSDYDQDYDGFDSSDYEGTDCDDTDAEVNTDAEELWYDGIDQNCDEASDYDMDGDGYDSASYGGDDCDDADDATYPGAPDEPYDGIINDCDNVDDDDYDQDGFTSAEAGGTDCDDANSDINPDTEEIWYDGVDQNCDENDDDQDEDGYSIEEDCDDTDPDAYPGAEGWTDDCEEILDTGDPDTGEPLEPDTGEDKDDQNCGCSAQAAPASAGFLVGLLGLIGIRRRR